MPLTLSKKLEILVDAAKFDASCASSGGTKRNARSGGLGSVSGAGICHAYTPDGRCVSLLKIFSPISAGSIAPIASADGQATYREPGFRSTNVRRQGL